jgi:hypothetical protein
MFSRVSSFNKAVSQPRSYLIVFILSSLIAPSLILNKIVFLILMIWTVSLLVKARSPRPKLMFPAFVIIAIFLYGYLRAEPTSNDLQIALQFFLSTLILLLIHFIEYFKIDIDDVISFCGKVLAFYSIMYIAFYFTPNIPYRSDAIEFFETINMARAGTRDYFDNSDIVFVALSFIPFLYLPFCLAFLKLRKNLSFSNLIWFLIYGSIIVVSGRRGAITVCLLFIVFAITAYRSFILRISSMVMAYVLIFMSVSYLILPNTNLFSLSERSNEIKIGHLESFFDQLNWTDSIFGSGLGSYYYSYGKNIMVSYTELTLIDMFRYFGIPLTVIVVFLMLLPIWYRSPFKGQRELVFVMFALYLILFSMTNPVLINSNGMLIVLWYWVKYREFKYESNSISNSIYRAS